jgi:uncharacterized spore protein YtfJ
MEPPEALKGLATIPERATAAACFGPAATIGDRTVIPVAEIYYGFGVGWGGGSDPATKAEGGGGGGGGGARARGVAVIELSPEGVRIHAVRDDTAITLAGIAFASVATAIVARTLLRLIRG